ncbi:MAG: hypothetical protein H7281_12705 [Bacteriovorax sp.]|nr:hypothetical protein [Bacteriovorax sp.]
MNKTLSLAIILLIVSGCTSEYNKAIKVVFEIKKQDQNHNHIFDGEVEPPIPNSDENDKTILGIDSNENGIRDDVDIWINRTAFDYNERMAMRQYARAEQDELRVCKNELKDEAARVVSNNMSAHGCLNALSDPIRKKGYAEKKIGLLTISNTARRSCLGFYDHSSYIAHAKSIEFHENCNFTIQGLENVIKSYRKFWEYSE